MTTDAKTSTPCTECGRPLRAARSVAEQRGPRCRAKVRAAAKAAALAEFADKPRLVARAEELIEAGGIVSVRDGVYRTVGSSGDLYLTAPAACTCKAGLKGRHVCHHRIAATVMAATRNPAPAPTRRCFALAA